MTEDIVCDHCGETFSRKVGQTRCANSYCDRTCAGLARRTAKTKREKVTAKAEYDREYLRKNRALVKAKKAAHHRRTYTPEKARAKREENKANGYDHGAYCREYYADPGRKAHKVEYDKVRRAKLRYGDDWEVALVLTELKHEICRQMPDKYERLKARGYYERSAQQRRRDAGIQRW